MKCVPQDYDYVFSLFEGKDRISHAVDWLSYWLKFKSLCGETGTVIFDIDDTLVTLVDNKEKIIPAMGRLYKLCHNLGFPTNIITARPESKANRQETERMLKKNGIFGYEAMYMMPSNMETTFESVSLYKYTARMDVATRHTILANCGDMWSDHCKFPTSTTDMNERDVDECAVFFLHAFPCLKLPGKY